LKSSIYVDIVGDETFIEERSSFGHPNVLPTVGIVTLKSLAPLKEGKAKGGEWKGERYSRHDFPTRSEMQHFNSAVP